MNVQRKSSPPTSTSPAAENDLEITAELPVLDVAAYEAATEARANSTDTWIAPAPSAIAELQEPVTELSSLDVTAVNKALVIEEAEQRSYDEKRIQLEAGLHSLSENLREVEDSLRRKAERVTEIETALATANTERANAESHAKQLQAELEQARAATSVVDAKVAELQRGIEERDGANQGLRNREKELEEKLALSDKALALVQRDLTSAHTQAASYYESLQSMEGRRGIFQDISTTLYWEVDERDAKLNHAEGQLAAAVARTRDLESSLIDRSARIAKLEKEMSGLGATVSDRESALRESARSGDDLKRNLDGLTANLIERDERIRTLEAAAAQQATVLAERQGGLDQGAAERATLIASINSLEGRLEAADKRVFELETAWRAAQARIEEMDAGTVVLRKRAEQLEAELSTVRNELEQRVTALQEAGTERGEHMARIAAGEARAQELEARMQEQQESVRLLQADSNASVARAKELESDLRAAEDTINRLEADLRGRSARLDELEKTNQEWRATVEEARSALTDRDSLIRRLEEETANSAVLLGAIQQRLEAAPSPSPSPSPSPDGDKRLLIRTEGDSEVVHVLGRKTTVGRTPENDLQIDAKFISRHHAVILAGPAHTIIEDLNSTNGVLVNGKRITRQTLKDGDSVTIGKALFRFAVRPVVERRFS